MGQVDSCWLIINGSSICLRYWAQPMQTAIISSGEKCVLAVLGMDQALVFSSDYEKYIGDICNIQYSCLKHIQAFCRNFAARAPEKWRRKPWVSHPLQKQVQTWTRFAAAVRSCTAPAWKDDDQLIHPIEFFWILLSLTFPPHWGCSQPSPRQMWAKKRMIMQRRSLHRDKQALALN